MEKGDIQAMSQRERDIYFLREAFKAARDLSQDANLQTGAVIVSPSLEIISRGANRVHFGLNERYDGNEERVILERPEKYCDLTHAERDAAYVANRKGISLVGCTLYATWTPCEPCGEIAMNNGIARFVTHQSTTDWYNKDAGSVKNRTDWADSIVRAIEKLRRSGMEYECISDPIGGVEFIFEDKIRAP
ncbi:hypothetical protein HOA55_05115 [archaeon]|jgi:dCMP deaminase|nr:hypothetical protein [archaeon]MBT3578161.1 hypothetical protein [archaeon]MBT6820709.1 hypothetical protein [archaeon]MBT6956463.1 hypothetical protein [archaeon]MBT7024882.1 hypothetical protein [archaeon]